MNTVVIEHINTARQALDEGAVQTVRRLLDLIENNLQDPTPIIIPRPAAQVQGSILSGDSTAELIHSAICDWISNEVGKIVSHSEICQWIDASSGIQLTWADKQKSNSTKTQVWRSHVSDSIAKLRDKGILTNEGEDGRLLKKRHYLVLCKP